ncbi:AzlD domain-containing protein [Micromonospora sp. NPDC005413]|uniref:AzlD domain-containing protein n=1 Tax=Micromonospora sp. NPDC005413 TaxID=3154563 RepID=UPI00339F94D8
MSMWVAILLAAAGCYALKLLGFLMPATLLEHPRVTAAAALLPVGVLVSLIVVQTVGGHEQIVLDARLVGVTAALVAVLLRAPFLVVIVCAAAATALTRLIF